MTILVKKTTKVSIEDVLEEVLSLDLVRKLFLCFNEEECKTILASLWVDEENRLVVDIQKIYQQSYLVYGIKLTEDIINALMDIGIKGVVYKDTRKNKVYISVYNKVKNFKNLNTTSYRKYTIGDFVLYSENVYFKFE